MSSNAVDEGTDVSETSGAGHHRLRRYPPVSIGLLDRPQRGGLQHICTQTHACEPISLPPASFPVTRRATHMSASTLTHEAAPELLERARTLSAVPRQLAFEFAWEVAPGIPAVPSASPGLRLVTDIDRERGDVDGLPDPAKWAAQLARAVAEVGTGLRPPGQLTRWVERQELARLVRRGAAYARHPSARTRSTAQGSRVHAVRSVRVCPVAPGIVETSAVLVGPERSRAVAIRLEAVAGRWLATAVDFG